MARFEILDANAAPLGKGPAVGDMLFELGMMYSVGRDVPVDLVCAHKWFNLLLQKVMPRRCGCAARSPRRCRTAKSRSRSVRRATGCG